MDDPVSVQRANLGWRWWCNINSGSVGGTARGWALTKRGAVRKGKAAWRYSRREPEYRRVEFY